MADTKTREHQYSIDGGNHSHQLPSPTSKQKSEGYTLQVKELANILGSKLGIPETELAKALKWNLGKIPYEEREDVAQELALKLLERQPHNVALAFIIAKGLVVDWWRSYKAKRLYGDADIAYGSELDDNGNELIATLVDNIEWQNRIDSELNAERIFNNLPPRVKQAVSKKLAGHRMTGAERIALHRFVKTGNVVV